MPQRRRASHLPLAKDDLTNDGQGKGVGTGSALDEPQDGIGDITELPVSRLLRLALSSSLAFK